MNWSIGCISWSGTVVFSCLSLLGETVTGLKGNMENLSVNTQEIETKLILDYLDNIWKIENRLKKQK